MLSSIKKIALVSAALASSVNATGYWKFCNNDDFTDCGIAVATNNKNCFQESGRESMAITEGDGGLYFPVLVGYSDENCETELGCNGVGDNQGGEQNINFNLRQEFKWALNANSFKFISGSPPSCPNGCTGLCSSSKRSRIEGSREIERPDLIHGNKRSKQSTTTKRSGTIFDKRQDGANFWFCDDDNCSENCGNKIEVNAEGCANGEGSRGSVYFTGIGSETWQLGAYDNDDCSGPYGTVIHATEGCNAVTESHNAWQILGGQD